jgi:hypothetical protein
METWGSASRTSRFIPPPPRKESPLTTEYEAGWAPRSGQILWTGGKSPAPHRESNWPLGFQAHSQVTTLTGLSWLVIRYYYSHFIQYSYQKYFMAHETSSVFKIFKLMLLSFGSIRTLIITVIIYWLAEKSCNWTLIHHTVADTTLPLIHCSYETKTFSWICLFTPKFLRVWNTHKLYDTKRHLWRL